MLGNSDRFLPLPALLQPLEGRSWDAAAKDKCWKLVQGLSWVVLGSVRRWHGSVALFCESLGQLVTELS